MPERAMAGGVTGMHSFATQSRTLSRYCQDLRHLIYWMEKDRSLSAPPEKIIGLRKLLVDMEQELQRHPLRRMAHSRQ